MKNRGDDATENVNFQRKNQRLQGRKNVLSFNEKYGGRCNRKCQFSEEETAFAGGPKISSSILMSFRRKIGGRCDRKCQFSKEKTAFAGCKNLRLNFDDLKHLTISILI